MDITDDKIGGCGVRVGYAVEGRPGPLGLCECENYELDEWSEDPFGEHRDFFCVCGHHRVMHATVV